MTDLINRIAALSPEKRQLLLQQLQQKTVSTQILPQRSRNSNIFPLSFAQQRLWFVDSLQPGNPFYNIPVAVRLQGELNISALEYSFNQLIQRHEALRTTFTTVAGEPCQEIASALQITIPVIDLRSLDPATQQQTIPHLATQEAQHPFDLKQAPLLRVSLLQLSETEYVLLFTLHHIISDIWSTGVLVQEIGTLYAAYCQGKTVSLPQLPIQYADFAVWQRERLQGDALATQLDYWKQQLANLTMLQLPTDRPRPAIESFRGAKQSFLLPKDLTQALQDLSQREGVTLFMTLLAAFEVLLQCYTSQDDIAVGSAIANRNRAEIEGIIGFFVNTLVLRTNLSGNPSFKELLRRVKDVTLDAYSHQDLPFEKLVEELQPERNLSHNPLFQVAFQLQNTPMPPLELPNLTLSVLEVDNYTTKVDLHLSLMETEEGLNGAFEYSTDLFDASTITRMITHWQNLLAAIIKNPDCLISDYSLLSVAEQQLLVKWNNTQIDYPQDCIHQIIERQVEKTPDAIALTFANQQLTYRELNTKANQLAHYLQRIGVRSETLVGICIERSPYMIVSILAILKAGGAYLPLDPAYPQERLAFMLDDAQVAYILTQSHLKNFVKGEGERVKGIICIDKDWAVISEESRENPCCSVTADNLAYVIYTSGSTGKPKGVLLTHRGLCNIVTAQQIFNVQQRDRILQFASLNFDASIWEIVLALGHGASLHLATREDLLPGTGLIELMRDRSISIATLPPSVLAVISPDLPALRTIIVAGEACSPDLVSRWGVGREFFNAYGPTETTICATVAQCLNDTRKPPIGKPIANTTCFVLDKQMQLVPIGVAGELYIGGVGIARGYLNRPDLTIDKFIPNPFAPETRLYKTGDLVRWLADGNLEFLGRIDNQVKLRGFRIELDEIAATLKKSGLVTDAIAISRDELPGSLVAYVVPTTKETIINEQVAQWRSLYDENYSQSDSTDATLNIHGWNSSYSDRPIAIEEMQRWINSTVERILALNPGRVLEIGCGSGLLLFRIAPHCEHYYATDFSQPALSYIQQQLSNQPLPVTLLHQEAEFVEIATEKFDTVIINSVVQYFPSIDYLLRVIEKAVNTVAPGGSIFIGDVRSLPLLEVFHTSVQLYQADDSLSVAQLRDRIQQRITQEQELVIDPAFFIALKQYLPRISNVSFQLKRGDDSNELTKFRYDVTLQLDTVIPTFDRLVSLNWEQQLTLEAVHQRLDIERPDVLTITGIPNSRLLADIQAREILDKEQVPHTVGELRATLAKITPAQLITPEAWYELGAQLSYGVEVSWSDARKDGSYDVIFHRHTITSTTDPLPAKVATSDLQLATFANNPLQGKINRQLIPQLREYLQQQLPEYAIPSAFVVLDNLPLTPNGKIDKRSLPAPNLPKFERNYTTTACNSIESRLIDIWAQILGIQQSISIHDNFFQLGGHSLLATGVMSRIRDVFELEMPVRSLFESPTIAQLAVNIETNLKQQHSQAIPPIEKINRDRPHPLSFAQQRLWFLNQLEPDSPLYNVPAAVRLTGLLDVSALERSFEEVIRLHEVLRTSFATVDSQPVQIIHPNPNFTLQIIDLQANPEQQEIHRLATLEALQPFDLTTAPLLRVKLLKLHPQEHILLLTMHHIASDGWSMGILVEAIATLYQAFSTGKPSPLTDLPIQYVDYAVWQRKYLQGEVLATKLAFWRQLLGGNLPQLKLPTKPNPPAIPTYQGASHTVELSLDLSSQILQLSSQEKSTLFMTLLAAFKTLLYRYTQQHDIVVGTDVANRTHSETESLIGFFVNLLVLRTDLSGNPTFTELLHQVREVTLKAYTHQDLPFEKLVEELRPERHLHNTPLFQVLFVLQNTPERAISLTNLTLEPVAITEETSKFDLALFVTEKQKITLNWRYRSDLFDTATITKMSNNFETLLSSIMQQPETRINDLEMHNESEKQQQILAQQKREQANRKKFQLVKPKAITLTPTNLIKTSYFQPENTLPLIVQPEGLELDPIIWANTNRDWIETNLLKQGAILFRGFQDNSVSKFEQFAQTICLELFSEYGDLPRAGVSNKVYTSTPYPADKAILFHNESSHLHQFPLKIWFFCVQPAEQRGETPIVDCRKIYQLLNPQVREKFAQKQLMYVRNYTDGLDVSWTKFFQTTNKTVVENYCRQNGVDWEWTANNGLRTKQVRPAIIKHPKTREKAFFNQIQLHHVAYLEPSVRESLFSLFGDNLPRQVYYGDGTEIEESVIREISEIYRQATISFPWQAGDILMLDNLLTAHGRNPYVGDRKIVVTMGEMINSNDVSDRGQE